MCASGFRSHSSGEDLMFAGCHALALPLRSDGERPPARGRGRRPARAVPRAGVAMHRSQPARRLAARRPRCACVHVLVVADGVIAPLWPRGRFVLPSCGHGGDYARPGERLVGPAVGGDRHYVWVNALVRQAVVHYTGSDSCARPMLRAHRQASSLAVIQRLSLGDPHCLSLRRFGSNISGCDSVPLRKLPWLGAVPAATCASHS